MTETEHKRSRCHISHLWGKGDTAHAQKRLLGGKKWGYHPRINDARPASEVSGLDPCNMPIGRNLKAGQVWKKEPDNWPKVNKTWKNCPYTWLSHLFTVLPTTREDTHALTPRSASIASGLKINYSSMCSPTCCAVFLVINFVSLFSFGSWKCDCGCKTQKFSSGL